MEKRKHASEEFKKRAVKMSHDPNRSELVGKVSFRKLNLLDS